MEGALTLSTNGEMVAVLVHRVVGCMHQHRSLHFPYGGDSNPQFVAFPGNAGAIKKRPKPASGNRRILQRVTGLSSSRQPESTERGGFEPPVRCDTYNGLANRRFRPLSHLSKCPRRFVKTTITR